MVAFIDAHRDDVRGRADLRGPADRPVGILRAQGPDPAIPSASPREPGGTSLWASTLLASGGSTGRSTGSGRSGSNSLREGVAVARCTVARLMRRLGLAGAVRGSGVEADDPPGHYDRPAAGPGHAPVHRDAAESAVGRGPDVRGHLAGLRLRGLRHRRVLAADRGLAGVAARCGVISPSTPWSRRCYDRPDRPVRPAGASQRSGRPIPVDSLHRAAGRGGHRALRREHRRFVRQRAGRDGHRIVQDRGNLPAWPLARAWRTSSSRPSSGSRGTTSGRLLEPLGYVPPAEFEQAYHDRQTAPAGLAVLT